MTMDIINKLVIATAVLVGVALAHPERASAQVSATVGSVRGSVKDKATGEAAIGATVIATSAALQGQQVAITEDGGAYFITNLPPGVYTLTVYYVDAKIARDNVLVDLGKEAVVNLVVDTSQAKGETILVHGNAPVIDEGSTKTGVTITEDYTRNVPTGRTFGGVLGAAAGAQDDYYGTSIAGSTSNENTYLVDGVNTTDTAYGFQAQDLPNEFLTETEVITGGYNAEYGRATGGIVNVITKTGGNELHGSVFGYLSPGSFSAGAKTIETEGGSVDSKTELDKTWEIGGEVGGPMSIRTPASRSTRSCTARTSRRRCARTTSRARCRAWSAPTTSGRSRRSAARRPARCRPAIA
jgi:hypothetical protein